MDAFASPQVAITNAIHDAIDAANGWRGRCVNLFARAEKALGQALLILEPEKKPPMLTSKKLERLGKLHVSDDAKKAIEIFAGFLPERAALAHGTGKI